MAPLLGPPVIYPSSTATRAAADSGDAFVDAITAHFNAPKPFAGKPVTGFTENRSATFVATGNPCLDFFFQVVPGTSSETLEHWLSSAWAHHSLTALKLVCHLRGVRGTGKSDKEGFYAAALWLHQLHPKTLALNIKTISRFGYLKDLPEILFRLRAGRDVRKIAKEAHMARMKRRKKNRRIKKPRSVLQKMLRPKKGDDISPEIARELRHKKVADLARCAVEKYSRDPDYKFLHDRISDCFAELLLSDLNSLKSGETCGISLAAKWCPSLDSSFDKWTLLCESIARRVFPRESDPAYRDLDERYYAYRVRDRLRKEVLVPLRRALELPELYMSDRRWDALQYERVPSVAMKSYKKHFEKHDPVRFGEFLARVEAGTAKIAAGALLPHEMIAEADDKVADLQWKRMVSDLLQKGKLTNCLAVCDVSGSMAGTPMEVAIALGILTSDLSDDPWKGKVITFSHDPQIHQIEGGSLKSKVEFVRGMDFGRNTDFQRVFDRVLDIATRAKLEEEKMIKRLFVFSDMEFDQASPNPWETDYEAIKRKFRESGYSKVPEMVFWNLRDSGSTPVAAEQKGVALVSGFSKNLLKIFLEGEGVVTPVEVMEAAISGNEYEGLAVFD